MQLRPFIFVNYFLFFLNLILTVIYITVALVQFRPKKIGDMTFYSFWIFIIFSWIKNLTPNKKNGEPVEEIVRKEQDTNKLTWPPTANTWFSLRSTVSRYWVVPHSLGSACCCFNGNWSPLSVVSSCLSSCFFFLGCCFSTSNRVTWFSGQENVHDIQDGHKFIHG